MFRMVSRAESMSFRHFVTDSPPGTIGGRKTTTRFTAGCVVLETQYRCSYTGSHPAVTIPASDDERPRIRLSSKVFRPAYVHVLLVVRPVVRPTLRFAESSLPRPTAAAGPGRAPCSTVYLWQNGSQNLPVRPEVRRYQRLASQSHRGKVTG